MENASTFNANNEIKYDKYDVDYTTHLKYLFNVCNQETQKEFNEFNPIMYQDVFCRFELLNITNAFEKIKKTDQTRMWQNFVENAFNYRPYQPCCIQ